jgi:lysozyme family protein
MTTYQEILRETLKWEGGYSNHPRDPGGATMRGVTQAVYDSYRARKGLAARPVREIEDVELQEIYKTQYWAPVRGHDLLKVNPGLALCVFDFAVNSGATRAIRYLQRCANVNEDGDLGESTLLACGYVTVKRYQDMRRKFVRQIKTYDAFGKGWENRINGIENAANRFSVGAANAPPPDEPTMDGTGKAIGDKPDTKGIDAGAAIGTAGGTAIIVKETVENVNQATSAVSGLLAAAPWVLLAIVVIGAAWFVWWKYREKIKDILD